jgi:hypothetical protein
MLNKIKNYMIIFFSSCFLINNYVVKQTNNKQKLGKIKKYDKNLKKV